MSIRSPSPCSRARSAASRLSGWFSRRRAHAARSSSTYGEGRAVWFAAGCVTRDIVAQRADPLAAPRRMPSRAGRAVRLLRMCGIVGYVGPNADGKALDVVMEGLARLEYRGYDSAGVALVTADGVSSEKRAGKLANLREAIAEEQLPPATTGIGHTRWATHGGPTDANAHPHRGGDDDRLALIHNGIIENFHQLKNALLADGASFESETDTVVAAHLVAREYATTGDLTEAMRNVVNRLEGAFTLLAVHADSPGVVVGARRNSPLVVGLGEGENFLG